MAASGASAPWSRTGQEVAKDLEVDLNLGLTDEQVAQRRAKYGYNELEKEPPTPLWKMILEQFSDTLVQVRVQRGAIWAVPAGGWDRRGQRRLPAWGAAALQPACPHIPCAAACRVWTQPETRIVRACIT